MSFDTTTNDAVYNGGYVIFPIMISLAFIKNEIMQWRVFAKNSGPFWWCLRMMFLCGGARSLHLYYSNPQIATKMPQNTTKVPPNTIKIPPNATKVLLNTIKTQPNATKIPLNITKTRRNKKILQMWGICNLIAGTVRGPEGGRDLFANKVCD